MSKRPKMLASIIREIISPILTTCPPECGIVSMTETEVSNDFSHVTVYISALQEPEIALRYLQKKETELQKKLGTLYRKRIPLLRFRIDERTQQGGAIDDLLNTLN